MIRHTLYVSVAVILVIAVTLLVSVSDDTRTFTNSSINTMIVPQSLKDDIDRAVQRRENIAAIQVVTVHFQRNIRVDTFISIDGAELQNIYNKYIQSKVVETPFFDSDQSNNKRLLSLINGEFVCVPFAESTPGKIAPLAGQYIAEVCAIGIPPRNYGEFTGILTIYLRKAPDLDNQNQLYLFARDLSVKIYDANKSPSRYIR